MLLLVCTYKADMCVVMAEGNFTLKSIHDRVLNRWSDLKDTVFSLYYVLKDNGKCLLRSDEDVHAMICLAESYPVQRVKVDVVVGGVVGSSSSSYNVGGSVGSLAVVVHDDASVLSCASSSNDKQLSTFGWDKVVLYDGQCFSGGVVHVRESLQKLCIQTGFKYVYKKNERCRIHAVCAMKDETNCGWCVRANKVMSSGYFYISELCNVHTCGTCSRYVAGSSERDRRMSSDLLSKVVVRKVREDPSFSASDFRLLARTDHGYEVPYLVAWSAVTKATDSLYGDVKTSFNCLPGFVSSVLETNPGSVVWLDVNAETRCFKRMFIAFDACIRGFQHCRPLLFLDGAHLKFDQNGHLLAATGKDGDDGLYPLCYGVVDSEDFDNWRWFLLHLKSLLIPVRQITFMTDRNPGLLDAVREVFPDAFHSYCIFHLRNNLKNHFSGRNVGKCLRQRMLHLFSKCALASTVEEYEKNMADMLHEGGDRAESFFQHLNPKNWATAHFEGCRYGHTASTLAESFNNWICKERHLPVLNMVDGIRIKIMIRLSERRCAAALFNSLICPKVDAILSNLMDLASCLGVASSSYSIYEVFSLPVARVDLASRFCSCKEWQRNGYPCIHAMAVIRRTSFPLDQYVDPCFLSQSYVDSYSFPIHPIPGPFLKAAGDDSVVFPPIPKKQPGRPRTKRLRSRGESSKRPFQCGRCHVYGHHNKKTCRARIAG